MLEFMREGGFQMFIILALGIASLASASAFAWRPDPRKVESIRALASAVLFATIAGIVTDISAVMHKVPANPEWAHSPDLTLIVMTGIGESMAPGILGFSVLSIQWLLVAYGFRRLARSL